MKVQSISASQVYRNNLKTTQTTPINPNQEIKAPKPYGVISFGAGKNEDSIIFLGAECPPFCQKGGVGTVMRDYGSFQANGKNIKERIRVIPYYNGANKYDVKGKSIVSTGIHQTADGKMWFTNNNITDSGKTFQNVFDDPETKGLFRVEEVKSSSMAWGLEDATPIKLLKVVEERKPGGKFEPVKDVYMIYTDDTSMMKEPYADGSYSSAPKSIDDAKLWKGDPYAKFDKAFVKLMPDIPGNSGVVVLSDPHTAFTAEYMAQEMKAGNDFYKGIKNSFVAHNLGEGYIQKTSYKNMAINLGLAKEEIKKIANSKEYRDAVLTGEEEVDKFFKNLLHESLHTKSGGTNPVKLIIKQVKDDYIASFFTVSEDYAESVAKNERISGELMKEFGDLYETDKFFGILNILGDKSKSYNRPMMSEGYGKKQTVEIVKADGSKVTKTFEPFKAFDFGIKEIIEDNAKEKPELNADDVTKKWLKQKYETDPTGFVKHIKEVKQYNRARLLERLSGEITDNSLILGGTKGKKMELLGKIDPKYAQNPDTKLFVSWGRGDFQKSLDTVYDAFVQFVKKTGDKNAVLVFGGKLEETEAEAEKIKNLMKAIPEELKGRVAYLNGWVPANEFASAADAALFPSRFAPCELTDLEAMKYFASPIVTNTQGLKQKNFDPRKPEEKNKMTSFKTDSEYYMSADDLKTKSKKFAELYDKQEKAIKAKYDARPGFVWAQIEADWLKSTVGVNVSDKEKLKEAWLKEQVLDDPKIIPALRNCADEVIADELADAMKARLELSDADLGKMWFNHMTLDTSWIGNAALHNGKNKGKSTGELYYNGITRKINTTPDPVKLDHKSFIDTLHDLVVGGGGTGGVDKPFYKNKWVLITAGAVAVAGAAYAFISKGKSDEVDEKPVFNSSVKPANKSAKVQQKLDKSV